MKTSRRDLSYVLSQGLNGGTTVSATTLIANSVGIDVFATGGIGGVHRQFSETFDISADLTELGRSCVAVISSGVKSILDIPKTLEYLETQGITVTTYQVPEKDFPAFYSKRSGHKAPFNINSPIEAAKLILTSKYLNSSILIAVPVPDQFAMNGLMIARSTLLQYIENFYCLNLHLLSDKQIDVAIEDALEKARSCGISGKEITPFLLSEIGRITNNESLKTSRVDSNKIIEKNLALNKLFHCRYCAYQEQCTDSRSNCQ